MLHAARPVIESIVNLHWIPTLDGYREEVPCGDKADCAESISGIADLLLR